MQQKNTKLKNLSEKRKRITTILELRFLSDFQRSNIQLLLFY